MSKLIAIIAGLVLLWALFDFGAQSTAPEIQHDNQSSAVAKNAVSSPYITMFCKDDSSISLSGEVPDDDARDAFPERARDMFRFFEVESN